MIRNGILMVFAVLVLFFVAMRVSNAQNGLTPFSFPGLVYVPPAPGVPFSAELDQETTQVLRDGSSIHRKFISLIARDSQGRTREEGHEVLPASSTRRPLIFPIFLYDPETKAYSILTPNRHVAAQSILPQSRPTDPPGSPLLHLPDGRSPDPNVQVQDLGSSVMDGIDVHGVRSIRTFPAAASGTGGPVVVTIEFWYSEEMHLTLVVKRNDPRTGSLISTVTNINVNEPDVDLFAIPPDYKVVDVTPPEPQKPRNIRVEP